MLNITYVFMAKWGLEVMVNSRRSELDLIGEILVLSKEGAKKTELLYQANLSYMQLQKYLPFLVEKNILEEHVVKNNGYLHRLYKTTEKGLDLLNDINQVYARFM